MAEISRAHLITSGISYNRKNKYSGMREKELLRLRKFESDNVRLEQFVADQSLDIQITKDVISGKW